MKLRVALGHLAAASAAPAPPRRPKNNPGGFRLTWQSHLVYLTDENMAAKRKNDVQVPAEESDSLIIRPL